MDEACEQAQQEIIVLFLCVCLFAALTALPLYFDGTLVHIRILFCVKNATAEQLLSVCLEPPPIKFLQKLQM